MINQYQYYNSKPITLTSKQGPIATIEATEASALVKNTPHLLTQVYNSGII